MGNLLRDTFSSPNSNGYHIKFTFKNKEELEKFKNAIRNGIGYKSNKIEKIQIKSKNSMNNFPVNEKSGPQEVILGRSFDFSNGKNTLNLRIYEEGKTTVIENEDKKIFSLKIILKKENNSVNIQYNIDPKNSSDFNELYDKLILAKDFLKNIFDLRNKQNISLINYIIGPLMRQIQLVNAIKSLKKAGAQFQFSPKDLNDDTDIYTNIFLLYFWIVKKEKILINYIDEFSIQIKDRAEFNKEELNKDARIDYIKFEEVCIYNSKIDLYKIWSFINAKFEKCIDKDNDEKELIFKKKGNEMCYLVQFGFLTEYDAENEITRMGKDQDLNEQYAKAKTFDQLVDEDYESLLKEFFEIKL